MKYNTLKNMLLSITVDMSLNISYGKQNVVKKSFSSTRLLWLKQIKYLQNCEMMQNKVIIKIP